MSVYGDLRKRYPFLTPPFVDDSESQRPKIRVAFGNKGLTGVEDPKPPIKLPVPVETTAPPETNPYEGYNPESAPPPTPNIRIGANTAGMNPIDRSVSVLDAQRQAAQDFPSSKVTEGGEILPPKMHHGAKDRLKSIGLGALMGLQRGGPGGAIAGAITGGVSPVTIDKMRAQQALARKTQEVGQQIDIETGRARLEDLRMKPALDAARIQAEADYRKAQQDIQRERDQGRITQTEADRRLREIQAAETARHNRELERQGQLRIDRPGAAQPDYGTRADWAYKKQHEAEATEASLRQQIEALGDTSTSYDKQVQKEALMKQLDEAHKNALKYRDEGDAAATQKGGPSRASGRTIEGAIDAFKTKFKRNPTDEEIQRMKVALGQ